MLDELAIRITTYDPWEKAMLTNWGTVPLEDATRAVKAYNNGKYGCLKNPELDVRDIDMFAEDTIMAFAPHGRVIQWGEYAGLKPLPCYESDAIEDVLLW